MWNLLVKKRKQLNLGAIVLWLLGIVYACVTPNEQMPDVHFFEGFDKLMHFAFYFVLIILLLIYRLQQDWRTWVVGLMIILVSMFGISIEFLQRFLEGGRSFSVADMLANNLGLIVGLSVYFCMESVLENYLKTNI